MTEKELYQLPTDEIMRLYELWLEQSEVVKKRLRLEGSDHQKLQIEGLELRERYLLMRCTSISTTVHPNIVVSDLARLQGQIDEVRAQLEEIRAARERKNAIDSNLRICENVLRQRNKKERDR